MSTPNFALKNASRYFVFGMPVYYTQEEIDEYKLDQELLGEYDELSTEIHHDDELKNEAELAFSMYCDEEMNCAYQCFNGEVGYSKTGKRLWQEVKEQNKKTA